MQIAKELISNIKNIIKFLKKEKIPFAVCGGIAFSALVFPKTTVDLDIIINLTDKDLKELKAKFERNYKNVFIHKKPMKFGLIKLSRIVFFKREIEFVLDLISLNKEYSENIISRINFIDFYNLKIPIISPEDLYILKKISERERDKLELNEIFEKYKDSIDFEYINKWLSKLRGDKI